MEETRQAISPVRVALFRVGLLRPPRCLRFERWLRTVRALEAAKPAHKRHTIYPVRTVFGAV